MMQCVLCMHSRISVSVCIHVYLLVYVRICTYVYMCMSGVKITVGPFPCLSDTFQIKQV